DAGPGEGVRHPRALRVDEGHGVPGGTLVAMVGRLLAERGVTLLSLDLDDTLLDTDGAAEVRVQAAVAKAIEIVPSLDRGLATRALQGAMAANPVTQGRMSVFMD